MEAGDVFGNTISSVKPLESERDQKAAIPEDLRDTHQTIGEVLAIEGVNEPWMVLCKRYIERIGRVEAERGQLRMERDVLKEKWENMRRSMEDKAAEVAVVRKQLKVAREERDAAWNAGELLLGSHCCDTGEVDYKTEWLDDSTTVCDVYRPFRSLARPIPAEPGEK